MTTVIENLLNAADKEITQAEYNLQAARDARTALIKLERETEA